MLTKRAYPLFNPSFYPADKLESNDGLQKEASLSSNTLSFVEKHAADDSAAKKTLFIVNGLGASDYYGQNRNGDAFFEKHLTSKQTPAEAKKNTGKHEGKCLPRYKTFVNGHAFEHHKNDDPENAIGDLLTSFWNDQMKRVEVIAKLNENKAEDVIRDYHDGKPIAWSMGAKVPFDICSVCSNKASSRREYCNHLEDKMGNTLEDGTSVHAINSKPRFFDLSIVTVPADETAYTLKVVGMDKETEPEDGTDIKPDDEFVETLKSSLDKVAEENKESDIVKEIIGVEAENMDITKVIEKFLDNEIDKEDLTKLLMCEFVGEKTARVMHEGDIGLDISCDISDLEKESASFEDLMKISDDEASRVLQQALGESGAIQTGNPPLQDLDKVREESDAARNRTGMAIAGGNVIADVLQKLRSADDATLKKYLKGRPGLVNFLLRLLAGSATGAASAVISEITSTGTPEPMMGQISGRQN